MMLTSAFDRSRAILIAFAAIIAMMATATMGLQSAEAHSSPGECSINRWNVDIGVSPTDALPGEDITFTVFASNVGASGCDVEDVTITFTDPSGAQTILLAPPNAYPIGTAEFQVGQVVYEADIADAVGGFWTGEVDWTGTLHQGGDLAFDGSKSVQVEVNLFDLDPTKTANGATEIEYEWEIDKTATPDWNLFDGDTGTSTYTVEVTKILVSDDSTITGTITIGNPTEETIEVTVTDSIDGQPAVVDCDGDNVVSIPAGGEVDCTYELTGAAGDEEVNTATVTITDGAELFNDASYEATADVVWSDPEVTLDEITVTDTNAEFGAPKVVSESDSWDYEITFSCANVVWDGLTGSFTHPNTAEIEETGQTADADVDVDCYRLDIEKTADEEFDRQYFWDITKVVDGDASTVVPAGSLVATFSYEVQVNVTGSTDSGHAVSGTVTITNPNPTRVAVLTNLVDELNDGTVVTLTCDWATENEIPAASSVECTYDVDVDGDETLNEVTATQQNYAFDHTDPPVLNGTTDYDASAVISFGAPTTVTDECVDLSDSDHDFGGNPPEICVGDALPAMFNYDITWNLNPEVACGVPQEFTNIATIVTNDTGTEHDDNAVVDVTVECADFAGCTPGFWRQAHHFDYWTTYASGDSFEAVFGVDVTLRGTGRTTYDDPTLLQAVTANGGDVNALARHAVAALLNAASADVDYQYTEAEIIEMVADAINGDGTMSMSDVQNLLVEQNELGCTVDKSGGDVT